MAPHGKKENYPEVRPHPQRAPPCINANSSEKRMAEQREPLGHPAGPEVLREIFPGTATKAVAQGN